MLRAYRRKKHFYRLKNGKLLNLKSDQLEELDTMMPGVSYRGMNSCSRIAYSCRDIVCSCWMHSQREVTPLPSNKEDVLQNILNSFQQISTQDIEIPQRYNELLRDYQKDGFRWLKLMHRYGFGGILADDMGLGKNVAGHCLSGKRKAGRPPPALSLCRAVCCITGRMRCVNLQVI